jgi:hypothetical protein
MDQASRLWIYAVFSKDAFVMSASQRGFSITEVLKGGNHHYIFFFAEKGMI